MLLHKSNLFLSFSLLQVLNLANGANILYLCGVPSPSHHFWNSVFVNGLATRGHNITVISLDRDENPLNGVHYIQTEGLYDGIYKEFIQSAFIPHESHPLQWNVEIADYVALICKGILETNGFKTLASYPDDFRFDLVITDTPMGGCLLGFVHKFKYPPLMSATPFTHPSYLATIVGGHHYYSYIPHYILPYSREMNFFQRFYNFIVLIHESMNWEYSLSNKIDKMVAGKFGPGVPPVHELEQRTAIALVSTHPVFDYTRPLPENVIPVGGLHIRDAKPVPKDLNDFIESSKEGAVLFTFGSNYNASLMSFEKRKALLDAFKQFPDYHFIWKFETQMTDLTLPKNVLIRPWLAQSDILAHPKIKAFITHGGLLGTFEALWRGVPMIGIPFEFDQKTNILKSIEIGVAEKLDYQTMTVEIIKDTLQKVLESPKYLENARKVSARFQDQKEKPLDRAVWWAEWLIRNPDCEYLKSPVLRLGLIVGNSYDVIASICFVVFLILFSIIKLSIFVVRLFKTNKSQASHRSQKSTEKSKKID